MPDNTEQPKTGDRFTVSGWRADVNGALMEVTAVNSDTIVLRSLTAGQRDMELSWLYFTQPSDEEITRRVEDVERTSSRLQHEISEGETTRAAKTAEELSLRSDVLKQVLNQVTAEELTLERVTKTNQSS